LILVLAAAALVATGLLISNILESTMGTGGASIRTFTNGIAQVLTTTLYVLWAGILIYLMIGLFSSKSKEKSKGPMRASSNVSLLAVLLILALSVLIISNLGVKFSFLGDGGRDQGGIDGGEGGSTPIAGGQGNSGFLTLILLATILAVSIAVYLKFNRRWSTTDNDNWTKEMRGQMGIEVVERAIEELYRGDDFRSVIIRMYQQMCLLTSEKEKSFEKYMTPREFAEMAIRQMRWPEIPVRELTSLFEEARYSDHLIDESRKDRAVRCLEDIRDALSPVAIDTAKGGVTPADG
jgi:hypothetical protein